MLSKEDEAFIVYWEKHRLARKKILRQFLLGVPLGLLITVPTVISLTSGWYKRAYAEANSADFDPRVLFVALLLIVAFTAIFWQRHQWDQHEQHYRELLGRRDRHLNRARDLARASASDLAQEGDGPAAGDEQDSPSQSAPPPPPAQTQEL